MVPRSQWFTSSNGAFHTTGAFDLHAVLSVRAIGFNGFMDFWEAFSSAILGYRKSSLYPESHEDSNGKGLL